MYAIYNKTANEFFVTRSVHSGQLTVDKLLGVRWQRADDIRVVDARLIDYLNFRGVNAVAFEDL